jgi:hypothetical protein
MTAKQTKASPLRTWTARAALSWGMFGDEAGLTLLPPAEGGIDLPALTVPMMMPDETFVMPSQGVRL